MSSGTIFASRKLSFVDLLAAIVIFVNGAKGVAALQLSRDLDVQYKTAFVLTHKLREAMAREQSTVRLKNIVEIDGSYYGGYRKPRTAMRTAPTAASRRTKPASASALSSCASAVAVH